MSAEPEGSAAPDPETLMIDCPNCGEDVIEGYIHDCPVSGSEIVIRQIDGKFQAVEREEPKDVDVELAPDQETVDIRDERSQKNFDQLVLTGAVRQLREILAQQKVQYHLSKNGIGDNAGKGHPEQLKREIKKTVEALFDVKVEAVNIVNMPGKMRRILGRPGMTAGWKKALVKLRAGQSIEIV